MSDNRFNNEDISQNKSTSLGNLTDDAIPSNTFKDLPDWLFTLINAYISYAMILVSGFGLAGNILIIATYTKIGFLESINISYCALGISDALSIPFIVWHAICFIPAFTNSDLPIIPRDFEIPTGGGVADTFFMTTACLTAYISVVRCLCVIFPFKVKTLVTPKRTLIIVITIFSMVTIPLTSSYCILYKLEFQSDMKRNRSLLMVRYRGTPLADTTYSFTYIYKGLCLTLIPLLLVFVCTVFLAIQLKMNAKWRHGNTSQAGKDATADRRKYEKDMRVVKTVLLIAVAFISLGILSVVRHLVSFLLPVALLVHTEIRLLPQECSHFFSC